jgi:hypothetical protein
MVHFKQLGGSIASNDEPTDAIVSVASHQQRNPELKPLLWPIEPIRGESLIGYIARLAAHNVLGSTKRILRAIGFNMVHGGNITFTQDEGCLARLAELSRISVEQIRTLRGESRNSDKRGESVLWGGANMPAGTVLLRRRRIAPTALAISPHHRADWMNSLLPYCPETFELLIDACPQCGANLRWTSAWGIGLCESKKHDVPSSGKFLPLDLHDAYRTLARLVSHEPEIRTRATQDLYPALRDLSVSDLITNVLALGRIERSKGQRLTAFVKLTGDPNEQARILCEGVSYLIDWPHKVRQLSQSALEERQHLQYITDRLRSIIYDEKLTGRKPVITEALPELCVSARHQSPAGLGSIILGNELKALAAIQPRDITTLHEGAMLGAKIIHRGQRTQAQFDRSAARRFIRAKKGARDYGQISYGLAIPHYAVGQLIKAGEFELETNTALALLQRYGSIRQVSVDRFCERLLKRSTLIAGDVSGLNLPQAMRIFGGGLKPWGDVFRMLLDGKIEFVMAHGREKPLATQINIRISDVAKLRKNLDIQKQGDDLEDHISMLDAEDVLNAGHIQIAELQRCRILEFKKNGMKKTCPISDVLELAKRRIFTAEAGAVLNHRHSSIVWKLEAMGLEPLMGGGYDRAALNQLVPTTR